MPAKNKFYLTFYNKAEHDRYFAAMLGKFVKEKFDPIRQASYDEGLNNGTAYGIDMAILALGRMGLMNPERCSEMMKNITEIAGEYGDLFDVDREENNDKDYWWSTEKMDQEIHIYSGDEYPTFKERYKR